MVRNIIFFHKIHYFVKYQNNVNEEILNLDCPSVVIAVIIVAK